MRTRTVLTYFASIALASQAFAIKNNYTLTPLTFPDLYSQAQLIGITDDGTELGVASSSYDGTLANILTNAGNFASFQIQGRDGAYLTGINRSGSICGYSYSPDFTKVTGFVRETDGTVTTIQVPGADQTFVGGIRNNDRVAGYYLDPAGMAHGFVTKRKVGKFVFWDYPGATATYLVDFNANGLAPGFAFDQLGNQVAFITDLANFTPITIPNSIDINPVGLNDKDEVVGSFTDGTDGLTKGFVYGPARFNVIDYTPNWASSIIRDYGSGSSTFHFQSCRTYITGINDKHAISGFSQATYYSDLYGPIALIESFTGVPSK